MVKHRDMLGISQTSHQGVVPHVTSFTLSWGRSNTHGHEGRTPAKRAMLPWQ